MMTSGPLAGTRVLEIVGLGPAPFCGMLLADLGADVVQVDRPRGQFRWEPPEFDLFNRGKRSILVDLKRSEGIETVLALAEQADIMFEGFRPGVVEKLGIGPEVCLGRQPKLVYGRMTGWGQEGPLAKRAGHDIDYIALTGALHAVGQAGGPPQIPLVFAGDLAGGLYLTVGLLAGLIAARTSGHGQVVEAAMVDTSAHLMTKFYGLLAADVWIDRRGVNFCDGGAPFYGVYATSDGRYMAVGAVEPKFFREFNDLLGTGIDDDHLNTENWPTIEQAVRRAFLARTQGEWTQIFDGTDACVYPVLSMSDAPSHPHLIARGTYFRRNGVTQPAPAPRFSRTRPSIPQGPCRPGEHTEEVIKEWLEDR